MREIPLFAIEIGDDRLIRQVRPRQGGGGGEKVKGYNLHSLFFTLHFKRVMLFPKTKSNLINLCTKGGRVRFLKLFSM